MKQTIMAIALLVTTTGASFAQTWGSDYNMGSIGVSAGTEASGTITLDCAEAGNAFVDQGALSIFVRPQPGTLVDGNAPSELSFDVDGETVSLPVSDNQGDGLVYEKTGDTLADATSLIGLLGNGNLLTISSQTEIFAQIPLDGAATALEGIETCLTP